MLSVYDFIQEHHDQIRNHYSLQQLIEDRDDYHRRFLLRMANDMIFKKILSNEYGNVVDMSLAKMCRDWCRKNIGV